MATELARSVAYWAAWCVAEGDEQAPIAAAAAKSYAAEAAVSACERSIQVHGGIGFTWEHPLHRYYKRAQWIQAFDGFPAAQRAEIAAATPCLRPFLITGASSGIGAACATRLAARVGRSRGGPHAGRRAAGHDRSDPRRHRPAAARVRPARRARQQRGHRDRRAARRPAARRAPPPARGERRRAARRHPGGAAGAAGGAGPDRHRRLDRRPERAAVPRRLRDLEVRARGDVGLAAARARPGRNRGLARRARDDPHRDLDEAAAAGRGRLRRDTALGSGSSGSGRSQRPGQRRPRRSTSSPMRSSTRSPPSARRRATSSAGTRRSARGSRSCPTAPATACSPARCSRAEAAYDPTHAGPDDGFPADAAARSCGASRRTTADKEIVTRLPDKSFHRYGYGRHGAAREAAGGRAPGPRARARRPRRDALLEPLPAPRGLPRHPVRRVRAAHAEPAPAPDRPRATSPSTRATRR